MDCGVVVEATYNNLPLWSQELTTKPEVCSQIPQLDGCTACLNIKPKANNTECVSLSIDCSTSEDRLEYELICLSNDLFDKLPNCDVSCPNNCSQHGVCKGGACVCESGFYGEACERTDFFFEKCYEVGFILGRNTSVCGEFSIQDCEATMGVKIGGIPIPGFPSIPIHRLVSNLQKKQCVEYFGCKTCLEWKDLEMNDTLLSGCSQISIECLNLQYPLFCVQDMSIVEKCLGPCPSYCSFHGFCEDDKSCSCDSGFEGSDCSTISSTTTPVNSQTTTPQTAVPHTTVPQTTVPQTIPQTTNPQTVGPSTPSITATPDPQGTTGENGSNGHKNEGNGLSGGTTIAIVIIALFVGILIVIAIVFSVVKYRQNRQNRPLLQLSSYQDEETQDLLGEEDF